MAAFAREFDLHLSAGVVHAARSGGDVTPSVIAIHGLSANHHGFDTMAPALTAGGRSAAAFDLRGRARSDLGPAGSFGIAAHARDTLEVAEQLDAGPVDLVGWSLGALIVMQAAVLAPERVRRLVLIDHVGRAEAGSVQTIVDGLDRLELVLATPEEHLERLRAAGVVAPWSEQWETMYRYELHPVAGGLTPRTSREAVFEDLQSAAELDIAALWSAIDHPVLVLRATVPIPGGLLVPTEAIEEMRGVVGDLQVVDVERNHFGVMEAGTSLAAVRDFLG